MLRGLFGCVRRLNRPRCAKNALLQNAYRARPQYLYAGDRKRCAFPRLRAPNGVRSPGGVTKKVPTEVETLTLRGGGDEGDPRTAAPPAPAAAPLAPCALRWKTLRVSSAPRPERGSIPWRGNKKGPNRSRDLDVTWWWRRGGSAHGCAARARRGALGALRAALENASRFLGSAPRTGFDPLEG